MKKLILILFLLLYFAISVLGHTGSVDSGGGHTDSSTGEYHYHHGYDAHYHDEGFCEYDGYVYDSQKDDELTMETSKEVIEKINKEIALINKYFTVIVSVLILFVAILVILEARREKFNNEN